MKTDSLFYRLFQRNPKIALELLELDFSGDSYRFGSEEIKQTAFRFDGIFTPLTDNPEQPIIFAEVQYQPDDDFYGRFFSEITLYLYRQKPARVWLALVIYPTRSVEKRASLEFKPFTDLPQLHKVYLEDYQHGELSLNLQLIRLIASDKKQSAKLACDLVQQHKLDTDTLDFIETLLVYKLPDLSREEIRQMLNLQEVDLKKSRFYQEVWGEGRQEGEQLLLQRMLIKRFGKLPESMQQRLQVASLEQLESWSDRLFDATTLESVFNQN
jgi:predicted transposase/invertase (TIGR01784 family)